MISKRGYTDNPGELKRIIEFRETAVKDGWKIWPTYQNESVESAATLEKEGFKMMICTRENELHKFERDISIWGPDRLAIKVPQGYSWEEIKSGVNVCGFCGETGVRTQRIAFANRSCEKCYPAAKEKHEKPGWCD